MSIVDLIRKFNRDRLVAKKAKYYSKDDIPTQRNIPLPQKIKKILLLHFQPGWGDFLYLSGLLKILLLKGLQITVGTSPKLKNRFEHAFPNIDIWDATEPPSSENTLNFDCIIDVDWVVGRDHQLALVKSINSHCITCSIVLSKLNLFDQYIDFSQKAHMSDRYAMVVSALTGISSPPILPYISFTEAEHCNAKHFLKSQNLSTKNFIYLNTEGSDDDRKFSKKQIFDITQTILQFQIPIIYHSPHYDIQQDFPESKLKLIPLPKTDFFEAAAIIAHSAAIITPDTSIVHLATALNIPAMAVFCENDFDYFGKFHLSSVWAPRSTIHLTVDPSSSEKRKTHHPIPIRDLTIDFSQLTDRFIRQLPLIKCESRTNHC